MVSLRSHTQGRLFDSPRGLYIPFATWTCGTQSAFMALPRRLTWDLHADVAANVATTWQPLTSVPAMVNGVSSSLTVTIDRWFRYEEEGLVRGSEGVYTRDGKLLVCCECKCPLRGGFCWLCDSRAETSFAYDPNSNSVDDSQNLSDYPPQPQYETYPCELCRNDSHYSYDHPPRFPLVYEQEPSYNQNNGDNYYPLNSPSFLYCDNYEGPHESFQCQPMNQNYFEPNPCYDSNSFGFDQPPQYTINHQEDLNQQSMNEVDDRWNKIIESGNKIIQILGEMVIQREQAANLSTQTPEPSRCFNYIFYDDDDDYDYEENEFIKSSVEDLVLIPSESEDTSRSDSECILPSCDDFSPIDVPEEKAVLENIESKDFYDSNLDKPDLLVTPLFDANKNECFDSGGDDDEINVLDCEDSYYDSEGDIHYLESLLNNDLVHHDPSIPAMNVASIFEGFTDEPPLEENDDFFDLEYKNDD
nr:hypothetical protein [Tanacetum cinerariifolium]